MTGGPLGHDAILSLLGDGLRIEPLEIGMVTGSGIRLSVGRTDVQGFRWHTGEGTAVLPAGATVTIESREVVTLPPGLLGQLYLDAVLAEKGLLANLPVLDPGTSGPVRITVHNASKRTWDLDIGTPFVLLVLMELRGTDVDVRGRAADRTELPVLGARAESHRGSICRARGCAACCMNTEMPLTAADVDRLAGLGHRDFWIDRGGWRTLRNVDGHCVFLKGKDCSIYADRPAGCRLYPIVFNADTGQGTKDEDCPYRREFPQTREDEQTLVGLVKVLRKERAGRLPGGRALPE